MDNLDIQKLQKLITNGLYKAMVVPSNRDLAIYYFKSHGITLRKDDFLYVKGRKFGEYLGINKSDNGINVRFKYLDKISYISVIATIDPEK